MQEGEAMRNLPIVLALAVLTGAALPAAADQPQPGPLAKSILLIVKPDRFPQFEEALRQHLGFHRTNNDPWAWHTWQIVNGENLGQYVLRTHGHQWRDFDANADLRRSDWADFLANVAPHLQSMSSTISTLEPGLSRWPAELARPELVSVTRFELTYQGFREFRAAVEKVHAAVSASDHDRHYAWTRTVNGADGPEMTLLVPLAGWADLEPRQPPLSTVIEQLYGAEAAAALEQTIGSTVRSISSSVVAYREDLSYQPAP
jgi:hypothetical protein